MDKLTDEERERLPLAEAVQLFLSDLDRVQNSTGGDFVRNLAAMRRLLAEAGPLVRRLHKASRFYDDAWLPTHPRGAHLVELQSRRLLKLMIGRQSCGCPVCARHQVDRTGID